MYIYTALIITLTLTLITNQQQTGALGSYHVPTESSQDEKVREREQASGDESDEYGIQFGGVVDMYSWI